MSEHRIGTVDEFPENTGVQVEVDGYDIAVFNLDGSFYAIYNRCTHKNAPLHEAGEKRFNSERCEGTTKGKVDPQNCSVRCPWHRLKWDLETGRNSATGAQLPTFDVNVVGNEVFLITG